MFASRRPSSALALCGCLALAASSVVSLGQEGEGGAEVRRPLKQPFDVKIQLGDSELAILDVRDRASYVKSHIPGAVHVDVAEWKDKSLSSAGLADFEWWAERLGKLGVSTTSQVVVYGDVPQEAARAWWILRYLGVQHASVLDGGFEAWKRDNYPLEWTAVVPEETTFTPKPETNRLCPLPRLKEAAKSLETKILDVRSAEEFGGDASDESTGHIPGAANLEWSELLQPDGTYKDAKTIRLILLARGFEPEDAVIVHCAQGGRASAATFALELAEFKNVSNYYPGWSEYGGLEDLPRVRVAPDPQP